MSSDKGLLRQFVYRSVVEKIHSVQRLYRPRAAMQSPAKAAVIFGVGAPAGIGAAVAMLAAKNGMRVYIAGRNSKKLEQTAALISAAGGVSVIMALNLADQDNIASVFSQIADEGYIADLVVDNIGTNQPCAFLDISPAALESSWRNDCLSGFFIAQHALKAMLSTGRNSSDEIRNRGTLIFTGASASLRGKAGFAAFSQAKAGLRLLAQSLAREFGPQGIHVAHFIIDGLVDGERLQTGMPKLLEQRGADGSLDPAAVAQAYWYVYQQHPSVWSHELDLRPFKEEW